jgi:hypothetical protein
MVDGALQAVREQLGPHSVASPPALSYHSNHQQMAMQSQWQQQQAAKTLQGAAAPPLIRSAQSYTPVFHNLLALHNTNILFYSLSKRQRKGRDTFQYAR